MSYADVGIYNSINGTTQSVTYDASVATTTAFARNCIIEVTATSACHMAHGTAPVATVANLFLVANVPRQFPSVVGEKMAFIKATGGTAGIAHVTEMQP